MKSNQFKRYLMALLGISVIVGIVLRLFSGSVVLTDRDILYSFEAKGTVALCTNDESGFSLTVWTSTGDGSKGIGLANPLKRWPLQLRPGVTFEKSAQSWTCRLDGEEVDLSSLLPRF